jgi:DNA-binding LacI/PurR family transcriptional regulator
MLVSVTIEQIAARAGVSPGTVSRVLNGRNKENRAAIAARARRIRDIALDMGYRPNVAARSMLTGRFGLVAMLTCGSDEFEWFPRPLIHGLCDGLNAVDSRLVINEFPEQGLRDPEYLPRLLTETAVDGLIVHLNPAHADAFTKFFRDERLTSIFVNMNQKHRCVYPDDFQGGMMLAQWLIERGHKRIAYFGRKTIANNAPHYSEAERHQGIFAAIEQAGLPKPFHLSADPAGNKQPERMRIVASEFADRMGQATAVICYEIEELTALMYELSLRGVRVPDDIVLATFHEREFRAVVGSARLPTAMVPFRDVGLRAVRMLSEAIESGDRNLRSVAVPYTTVLE